MLEGKFESTTVDGITTLLYEDKDAYMKGSDLTQKQLKDVAEYNSEYIKKATELAATQAKAVMEKDSTVEKVFVNFPYSTSARGSVEVIVDKSKTFRNPLPGHDDVTKTAIKVAVNEPHTKVSKTLLRSLESELTEALLK